MTARKLAAILSADVVGYSRLMADDEAGTVERIKAYRDAMATLIHQHAGRVVDAVGDNVLAEFASVVDAVACGVAIQADLADRNQALAEPSRMHFRIGIHLGDVIVDGARLYGDGVNIAARVEALAEPGGVSVSGSAFDQVEGKLGLEFEDLGPQELKNLARPVRVYRVRGTEEHARAAALSVPGFSGQPAIAVIPFEHHGADADRDFLADGLTEELITRLSTWRAFPVIAGSSTAGYRGATLDPRQIAAELGARYLLQGTLRSAGKRVRTHARLIDAPNNQQLWAQQYDRDLDDVFSLIDEISAGIVAAVYPQVEAAELERARRREPASLSAWEAALRGRWYLFSVEKSNARARELFERAAELDPYLVFAQFGIAMSHLNDVLDQTSPDAAHSTSETLRAAERCIELDSGDALGYVALAAAHNLAGRGDEMLSAAQRAVELNPSMSRAHQWLGYALVLANRPEEAIASLDQAMRLSPKDPLLWIFTQLISFAHFAAERYAEALAWAERSLQQRPSGFPAAFFRAASLAELGRLDEARAVRPRISIGATAGVFAAAEPQLRERVLAALRKAGVPD